MTAAPDPTAGGMSGGNELILLQVKIPRALVRRVDHIAIELGGHRAVAVVHLLELGLARWGYQSPQKET